MALKNFVKFLSILFLSVLISSCGRTDFSDPDSMLISAAKKGDVQLLRFALAKGAYINAADDKGGTALHWAVYYGHKEVVKILLMHGADPYIKDKNGISPYSLAEIKRKKEILKLLKSYR